MRTFLLYLGYLNIRVVYLLFCYTCLSLFTIYCRLKIFIFAGMADQTPELFDRVLDQNHRSYRSAMLGQQLVTFRPRTSIETLLVDDRYVQG